MTAYEPLDMTAVLQIIALQAKCDLYFCELNFGKAANAPQKRNAKNDLSIVVTNLHDVLAVKLAVTNVSVSDLLDSMADKAEFVWEIQEKGIVIDFSNQKTHRFCVKTVPEPSDSEKPPEELAILVSTNDLPKSIIDDDKPYGVISYDFEAPTRITNPPVCQFEYESIYILPHKPNITNWEGVAKNAIRVSPIGKRQAPVWNKKGDKIAYIDRSEGNQRGRIIVLNVRSGLQKCYTGTGVSDGLSWDEGEQQIAFCNLEGDMCLLDTRTGVPTKVCRKKGEGVSLSPDGRWICFMSRGLPDENNIDGWLLNIVRVDSQTVKEVGTTNDNFGVIWPFEWMPDSKSVVFSAYTKDKEWKHVATRYQYSLDDGQILPYQESKKYKPYDQKERFWTATSF